MRALPLKNLAPVSLPDAALKARLWKGGGVWGGKQDGWVCAS